LITITPYVSAKQVHPVLQRELYVAVKGIVVDNGDPVLLDQSLHSESIEEFLESEWSLILVELLALCSNNEHYRLSSQTTKP